MSQQTIIRYYGWSSLEIHGPNGRLFFDPFFRKYCSAQWYNMEDITNPDVICVTHGHEEHYLDVPEIAKKSGATVVATKAICNYLKYINKVPKSQLQPIKNYEPLKVNDFIITTFPWQHRDINVFASVLTAIFTGNSTKLKWAYSSFTRAPFYGAFTGFHVELPNGLTVLNYNEGFNTKMKDSEIKKLGDQFHPHVLLAGIQMHYPEDVARGAEALQPEIIILYPPHEYFHKMMGATMSPWEDFSKAVKRRLPNKKVIIAYPGTTIDAETGEMLKMKNPTVVNK